MSGLYRTIRDDIIGLWGSGWPHADVPIFWRSDDLDPRPDPGDVPNFMRNEIDFGLERTLAYGGGRGQNTKGQYGSVILRIFTARSEVSEDTALDLIADAMAVFRSQRITDTAGGVLSFIGDGSGFTQGPTEDGNWFMRGSLMVFEYRFIG
jgi:hypothetical protein